MKLNPNILCNDCRKAFKEDDLIVIDVMNTLCHQFCFPVELYEIKDRGTYKEIGEKYPYFYNEVIH
ncbi:hypothetical protein [Peribacillus loiseleuriae]|uniref:hypothetical protein n=1 Tax=Peribacillus loiseleuriae TaxID=1679170 RepID=UPI003D0792F3